jgi:hypothetical protein
MKNKTRFALMLLAPIVLLGGANAIPLFHENGYAILMLMAVTSVAYKFAFSLALHVDDESGNSQMPAFMSCLHMCVFSLLGSLILLMPEAYATASLMALFTLTLHWVYWALESRKPTPLTSKEA